MSHRARVMADSESSEEEFFEEVEATFDQSLGLDDGL